MNKEPRREYSKGVVNPERLGKGNTFHSTNYISSYTIALLDH